MIEEIKSMTELLEKYEIVTVRRPMKGDLVYVPSQQKVFEVQYADRLNVRVEREHKGSGLLLTLPQSHYKLVEKKKK